MVGDADQSIYAFRGATIRNILQFEEDYPDARVDPARAELPLHADDPVRGQRRHLPQRGPQAQEPVVRPGRRSAESSATSPTTSTTRRSSSREEIDRLDGRGTGHAPATSRCSTAPTRSAACSKRSSSVSACPTRSSAACGSTSAGRCATRWPTCGCIANPEDSVSLRRILNVPKRGIGDRAEAFVEAFAQRERITFWQALRRADEAQRPGHPVAQADRWIRRPARRAARRWPRPPGRRRCSRRCWAAPATSPSSTHPTTRRTRAGPRTSGSSSPSPASSRRRRPTATWPTSWSRSSLVADADQIPEGEDHGGVVTLMTLHTAKGLEFPVVFLDRPGGRRLPAPAVARRAAASWRRSAASPTSASPGRASGST